MPKTMSKVRRLARLIREAMNADLPEEDIPWEEASVWVRREYLRMASVLLRRGVRLPEEDS